MSQSLAKIYVHLIFSTKNREKWLMDGLRTDLHAYIGGILRDLECPAVEINSVPDHAHLLFCLARTKSLAEVVGSIKSSSSRWLNQNEVAHGDFQWQRGYGAFSVSQSILADVTEYIRRQPEHHQTVSFQDELRAFLKKYEIDFDERYVWD